MAKEVIIIEVNKNFIKEGQCGKCKYFISTSKGIGSCEADDYNDVKTTDTCDIYEGVKYES